MKDYKIELSNWWTVTAEDEEHAESKFWEAVVNDGQSDAQTIIGDSIKISRFEYTPMAIYMNGSKTTIDGTVIDPQIECDYQPIDRESEIDNLITWIYEADGMGPDAALMKEDLQTLMGWEDEYILTSTSTNSYLSPSLDPDEYEEQCNAIIAQNQEK